MSKTDIEQQIIKQLQDLEEAQQLQILNFAKSLAVNNAGVAGKSLLKFAGSIPEEELELMSDAINQECRKIDLDEW
ncbi:MAG: hypothetical protein AAFQ80_02405 [Cyanobacteria bacterium J06621_8]